MTKLESLSEYCESVESLKRVQIKVGRADTVFISFECTIGAVMESSLEAFLDHVWISRLKVDYSTGKIGFQVFSPGNRDEVVSRIKRDLVAAGYEVTSVVSSGSEGE